MDTSTRRAEIAKFLAAARAVGARQERSAEKGTRVSPRRSGLDAPQKRARSPVPRLAARRGKLLG
jgi:hypothetical protein